MKVSSSNFVRYFQYFELSIWMMKPISVAKIRIFNVFLSKAFEMWKFPPSNFLRYFPVLKLLRLTRVWGRPLVKINHFAPCEISHFYKIFSIFEIAKIDTITGLATDHFAPSRNLLQAAFENVKVPSSNFAGYFPFLKLPRLARIMVWPLVKINHFAPCEIFHFQFLTRVQGWPLINQSLCPL